ncbi:GNAT family N-acetyltransferase [Clostridium tagluense]|uniref:GNAT family N-acetyltransferase n=1 Tax=Clostridium tagluense TaxID=360422 RepID=UPI001C0D3415|nr:GNAT family N-acetyltransferase [Clostridium tagluense]MBU3128335.1 GNAT family N-acetyltransferase [Clostridium tagluense]
MNIYFKKVTSENYKNVILLSVEESQRNFIESNKVSLEEAKTGDHWRPVAIYNDNDIIGFAMYGYFHCEKRVWLDRLMIDKNHQGKGYGKFALKLLINHIISEYKCDEIYLSILKDNVNAQRLYEEFNFRFNGELDISGEFIMVLKI